MTNAEFLDKLTHVQGESIKPTTQEKDNSYNSPEQSGKSIKYLKADFLWKNSARIGYVKPRYKRQAIKVIKYKWEPITEPSRVEVSNSKPEDKSKEECPSTIPTSSETALIKSQPTPKHDSLKPSQKLSKYTWSLNFKLAALVKFWRFMNSIYK